MSKIRTASIDLYRQKGKIHSRTVNGRFNTLRWAMVWISQLVFYGTCWLNFVWIEGKVEGDHIARLRLDNAPPSMRKLALRGTRHALWLLVATWTGITFVGYFTPIDELLGSLVTATFGSWEGFWVFFYALFPYLMAGFAREAVCQHMCPYARFQGAMFDAMTSTVAYDARRGEPRGARRQTVAAPAPGDCIDCGICVQVCPTGIDIRDGLQYQCINCGLCADACDKVMEKTGAPKGLIRFAAEQALAGTALPPVHRRPRVAIYGALLHESAEGIENAYTLKLMNRAELPQDVEIAVTGVPGLRIVGETVRALAAGSIRPVQLTLVAPGDTGLSGMQPIRIEIRSKQQAGIRVVEKSTFALP